MRDDDDWRLRRAEEIFGANAVVPLAARSGERGAAMQPPRDRPAVEPPRAPRRSRRRVQPLRPHRRPRRGCTAAWCHRPRRRRAGEARSRRVPWPRSVAGAVGWFAHDAVHAQPSERTGAGAIAPCAGQRAHRAPRNRRRAGSPGAVVPRSDAPPREPTLRRRRHQRFARHRRSLPPWHPTTRPWPRRWRLQRNRARHAARAPVVADDRTEMLAPAATRTARRSMNCQRRTSARCRASTAVAPVPMSRG